VADKYIFYKDNSVYIMVKIIPTLLIITAIFFVSIGIVLSLGMANGDTNLPLVNADSITDPASNSNPSITSEVVQMEAGSPSSTLKLSGKAITCSIVDSKKIVDLRIENNEDVSKSVTVYPVGKEVTLLPKQILRIDIPVTEGTENLILYSDETEEGSVLVPPCSTEGYSSSGGRSSLQMQDASSPDAAAPGVSPTGTVAQPPTEDPTEVPEFPSIALPILSLIAIMFIMQKRK